MAKKSLEKNLAFFHQQRLDIEVDIKVKTFRIVLLKWYFMSKKTIQTQTG